MAYLLPVMSKPVTAVKPTPLPGDVRIAIVAAKFNAHIVDVLLEGCIARLSEWGVSADRVIVERVPGAYELPIAAQAIAQGLGPDAIICLGCVIRGDTPHFEYVAGQAAQGIMQVSLDSHLPVIFGVLTTNTEQQSLDRAGGSHSHAGRNAADTAAEMIPLMRRYDSE